MLLMKRRRLLLWTTNMRFIAISKFLMIFILPFILVLGVAEFTIFDDKFFQREFSEFGVQKDVPQAVSLHEKVINFLKGRTNELPEDFNEREKQHLLDVRNVIRILTALLYIFVILFASLFVTSARILKANSLITNFIGKVLVFGGFLAIVFTAILFFLISSDFSTTFESFHKIFFEKGTYLFDPAKEIIVRLYPEELFMDLALKISKGVVLASVIVVMLGLFLRFKPKNKKNKNRGK